MNRTPIDKAVSLAVRASSWGPLFNCAYGWEGENILEYRKPAGVRALLGTSIHAGTAAFDQGRIDHNALSIEDAAYVFLRKLRKPEFDVDYGADAINVREAELIGLRLLAKYCREISVLFDFSAVEMETKPLDIDCGNGVVVRLTGTMDRSRSIKYGSKLRVADIKSGVRAVQKGHANTHAHAAQIGTYCLLTEHTTSREVDTTSEIIGMKTSGKPEIAVGEIKGAAQMMIGTDEYPGLIEIAAQMFGSGLFPPNPSSILCRKKYCARWDACHYHL